MICMESLLFAWVSQGTMAQVIVVVTTLAQFTPLIAVYMAMPLVACYRLFGTEWLFADMSEECWTVNHYKWVYGVAVPSLILNFLAPVLVVFVLFHVQNGKFQRYLLFWSSGYKCIHWDYLSLLFRLAYTVVLAGTVSITRLVQLTYGLVALIVICMIMVAFRKRVYSDKKEFLLAEMSMVVVTVTHAEAGNFIYYMAGESEWRDYTVSAALITLNLGVYIVLAGGLVCPSYFQNKGKEDKEIRGIKPPQNSFNSS